MQGKQNQPPKQAEKKVSQIILTFSQPILSALPEKYTKDEFDAVIRIALAVWNAVVIDAWSKGNANEAALLLASEQMPDEGKLMIKRLIKRKKTKFSSETWAVGEHWLREEHGKIIFGCDARTNTPIQPKTTKY